MKKHLNISITVFWTLIFSFHLQVLFAQSGTIKGLVKDNNGEAIAFAKVYVESIQKSVDTDEKGFFEIRDVPYGNQKIVIFSFGKEKVIQELILDKPEYYIEFVLAELNQNLKTVTIETERYKNFGRNTLKAVENFGIYEGKKTEVVEISELTANVATNNARQVYAKVTGLNIWESDGAGLQLGIGGRGLSPNRTANFNVRQNGYDISADALGYPESYYTPPVEALDRIELVRGAASLQYGTQFGGMLNFRFKKGPSNKAIELNTRNTVGSWGFFNHFTSVGGTHKKVNYYGFFQYKRGDGFRANSGFESYNGFMSVNYQINDKLQMDFELTKMNYLAQQPGGLTDKNFEDNPRRSFRDRNWFEVNWNMAALSFTYSFSENTQINSRTFGLLAHRYAVGNLERINVVDFGENRTLIAGDFMNIGNESRLLHQYKLGNQTSTVLTGFRLYRGSTTARQGHANKKSSPDFNFLNPDNLENSDYTFTNKNFSYFIENIFKISKKISITPGVRFESIGTYAEGYFNQQVFDRAGNLIVQNRKDESLGRTRNFVIAGIGANYYASERITFYANISQNYRAINFSDIRIVNPNFRVDPNIKDETGHTADIGVKAMKANVYSLELTAFMVKYNDKIGQILRADQAPLFIDYRFRGNISDARNVGLEFFGELNVLPLFKKTSEDVRLSFFVNSSIVDANYINTQDNSIKDKKVEMVPPFMMRSGSEFRYKMFRAAFQFSHVSQHYTDATNAVLTSTAVEGLIPSYQVADLSFSYQYKRYGIEFSINNLFNQMYFTRRSEGYPGPGIIPSDGRGFFVSLSGRF